MKKLSPEMKKVLRDLLCNINHAQCNKSTIKALANRGLLLDGRLTAEGRLQAIELSSLTVQCKELQFPLEDISLSEIKEKRPEETILKYYSGLGFSGSFCEGYGIIEILHALTLDTLTRYNSFSSRQDAVLSRFSSQVWRLKKSECERFLVYSAKKTKLKRFKQNLCEIKEIRRQHFLDSQPSGFDIDTAVLFVNAMGRDRIALLIEEFIEDPTALNSGWPDLSLIKGSEIKLIEVKSTDKLLRSQISTITSLQKIFPNEISVTRLIKP